MEAWKPLSVIEFLIFRVFVVCPCKLFFHRLMETQVWSGRFWMGRFKSLSPKPHVMYSNDKNMILLLCRKAGYMSREEAQQCPVRTSKTYLDSRGQKRCVGRKKELRESQSPAWIPMIFSYCFGIEICFEKKGSTFHYLAIVVFLGHLRFYTPQFGQFVLEMVQSRAGDSWLIASGK